MWRRVSRVDANAAGSTHGYQRVVCSRKMAHELNRLEVAQGREPREVQPAHQPAIRDANEEESARPSEEGRLVIVAGLDQQPYCRNNLSGIRTVTVAANSLRTRALDANRNVVLVLSAQGALEVERVH